MARCARFHTHMETPTLTMANSPQESHRQLTFADLFCGAGGLSLGFQKSGFQSVAAIDNNQAATATYDRNFPDHIRMEEISEKTSLPKVDLIIGGPPCQGFSSAGLRRSDDKRNTLVRVFSELVANQKPMAFVFENVEGFLTAGGGNRVFDLLEPLIQAGYQVHLGKINAANFGVPQHRKRVIAIGGLGWSPRFPAPTHSAHGAPGASRAFTHLPPCPTLTDALRGLPNPSLSPLGTPDGHFTRPSSEQDLQRMRLLKPGQTMKDLPTNLWHESYRRRAFRRVMDGTPTERRGGAPAGLRRLRSDQPCKAITSGATSEFIHPTEDRPLTLRECARVQTFPDEFSFMGNSAEVLLQIGNAVPPRLAEVLAATLKEDMLAHTLPAKKPQGALLSFILTVSDGMSPALADLWERVNLRFLQTKHPSHAEQMELWR